MLTIHHLGVSQSDRIVWLMEELNLPYTLKWYTRGPNRLAPPEFVALHPAATAPVVEDDGRMLCESAAIVEYICHRYAGGRFTVAPSDPAYYDYVYWMQFNNNILGLYFASSALGDRENLGERPERVRTLVKRRQQGYFRHLDARLGEVPFLAGAEFTCADIMSAFMLTSLPLFGGWSIEGYPNAVGYVNRIKQRPAYIKAMAIAGPDAKPPAS